MRDFLLDTQTIRYWHDSACNQHAALVGNVAPLRQAVANLEVQPKLLVSVVSLGEIEYGHNDRMTRLREVAKDISTPLFTQNWAEAHSAYVPQ